MDPILKAAAAIAISAVVVVAVTSIGRREAPARAAYPVPAYSQALNARAASFAAQVGPTAPKATAEAAGVRLRSVGFEVPSTGQAFPPGPGVDAMTGHCVSCHTPGMILNQPALTRAEWAGEVTKMVKVYKAPIDDADVPGIVAYLAALKVAP